ncbi:sce7726 family protein [uncultured Bacteroides sp.]|uniref:sce7726 family protein n=1 Tax=uncultured Bacteroides sp. TaxID=162156 RepID=UPI002AAAA642|nr:sce7726 family protein [uncultured Bacteroides sp.]
MNALANADIIKAKFIDYVLNEGLFTDPENLCIGQEVMYGINKMLADMVVIANDKLYAIEIKAQNDSFKRLENQLLNYKQIFDYVYVVVTKNHLAGLENISTNDFGVLVIDENFVFNQIRHPKKVTRISKEDVLGTMPATYLRKCFSITAKMDADTLRARLMKQSALKLKTALLNYMKSKIVYKYENFLEEKGTMSHYEDISILSLRNYSILK